MTRALAELLLGTLGAMAVVSAAMTLAIAIKSLQNFTHAGPRLRDVVFRHYKGYVAYATLRLWFAVWVVCMILALPGAALALFTAVLLNGDWSPVGAGVWSFAAILVGVAYHFAKCLLLEPGTIAANSPYRISRFYPLWARLSPGRLRACRWIAAIAVLAPAAAATALAEGERHAALLTVGWLLLAVSGLIALLAARAPRAVPPADRRYRRAERPNVLMIGCDTLRADRVVPGHYHRDLAPNIRALAQRGTLFANCYVPIARTAPSLVSLLTGAWPQRHGIRDNFVAAEDLCPDVRALPALLSEHGYRTVAISDWAGSDLGKFDLGFDEVDAPEDQWNIKYLIRQGPKDLRLFLSLFTHNELGRRLLPEIYYLPGRPLVSDLGTRAMQEITRCVDAGQPFLVNVFMAAGHPPFSVEYPYYLKYASPDYRGESKFVMSKLTDPMEIIRSQQSPREAFDLDQIIDLYDGCVHRFDVEVGRIVRHLQDSGLIDSTIVVIYGDHGMEFFEHGTWGQGNSALGDFSARIPLVIRAPAEPPRGIVSDVVRSIDLVPTLLRQLGVEIPGSVDGADLFGEPPAADAERTAYFETGIWLARPPNAEPGHLSYPDILKLLNIEDPECGTLVIKDDFAVQVLRARDRLVRYGQWVMLYQPFESRAEMRLYDLNADPAFVHDVAGERPDIVSLLYERLQPFLSADA